MAFLRAEPAERTVVMEDLAKADEDRFASAMMQRMNVRVREVMGAVNAARTGHLIDDSEGPVLELLRELDRELYQAAIQARVDATEAAASFSPSGGLGTGDGGSGAAKPLGTHPAGPCAVDASAILEPRQFFGGPGGCIGGSGGGDGERGRS